jgi:hypothetical protein
LFSETIIYIIVFGLFVPVVWWFVGRSADVEFGLGRALGQVGPPLREKAITLSCGISTVVLLAVRILGHSFSARFLGLFWIVLVPASIITGAAKWRRTRLPLN